MVAFMVFLLLLTMSGAVTFSTFWNHISVCWGSVLQWIVSFCDAETQKCIHLTVESRNTQKFFSFFCSFSLEYGSFHASFMPQKHCIHVSMLSMGSNERYAHYSLPCRVEYWLQQWLAMNHTASTFIGTVDVAINPASTCLLSNNHFYGKISGTNHILHLQNKCNVLISIKMYLPKSMANMQEQQNLIKVK